MTEDSAPDEDGEVATPDRARLLRLGLLAVLMAVVAYTVLLSFGDIGASVRALGDLTLASIGAAVGAEAAAMICLGAIYRAASSSVGSRRTWNASLNTSMSTYTVTQLVPAGGAVAVGLAIRRLMGWGMSRAGAAATSALASTVPLLALVTLAGAGVAKLSLDGTLHSLWFVAGAGGLLLLLASVVGFVLWVMRTPSIGRQFLARIERLLSRWDVDLSAWHASLEELSDSPPTMGQLSVIFGWATLRWVLEATVLWTLFSGLGASLSVATVIVGMSVQHLAVMVPITPGGLGFVEAGMSGAFIALGTPAAIAIPAVLSFRLVSYWLPTLAGVPQYFRSPVSTGTAGGAIGNTSSRD